MSRSPSLAIFRIFPLFSGIKSDDPAMCESSLVSSRKLQAGTSRGEDGNANETRRCLSGECTIPDEEAGNGALNENVDADGGLHAVSFEIVGCSSMVAMEQ